MSTNITSHVSHFEEQRKVFNHSALKVLAVRLQCRLHSHRKAPHPTTSKSWHSNRLFAP